MVVLNSATKLGVEKIQNAMLCWFVNDISINWTKL
jgi:hypothetical protein